MWNKVMTSRKANNNFFNNSMRSHYFGRDNSSQASKNEAMIRSGNSRNGIPFSHHHQHYDLQSVDLLADSPPPDSTALSPESDATRDPYQPTRSNKFMAASPATNTLNQLSQSTNRSLYFPMSQLELDVASTLAEGVLRSPASSKSSNGGSSFIYGNRSAHKAPASLRDLGHGLAASVPIPQRSKTTMRIQSNQSLPSQSAASVLQTLKSSTFEDDDYDEFSIPQEPILDTFPANESVTKSGVKRPHSPLLPPVDYHQEVTKEDGDGKDIVVRQISARTKNVVRTYSSVHEAHLESGLDAAAIQRALDRGVQLGGYFWSRAFEEEDTHVSRLEDFLQSKKILNGSSSKHGSSISNSLESKKRIVRPKPRSPTSTNTKSPGAPGSTVAQVCVKTGRTVAVFASIRKAALATGLSRQKIGAALDQDSDYAGFKWRTASDDETTYSAPAKKPKLEVETSNNERVHSMGVVQVDAKTEDVVNTYSSLRKAEGATGFSRKEIKVAIDTGIEYGGFYWLQEAKKSISKMHVRRKPSNNNNDDDKSDSTKSKGSSSRKSKSPTPKRQNSPTVDTRDDEPKSKNSARPTKTKKTTSHSPSESHSKTQMKNSTFPEVVSSVQRNSNSSGKSTSIEKYTGYDRTNIDEQQQKDLSKTTTTSIVKSCLPKQVEQVSLSGKKKDKVIKTFPSITQAVTDSGVARHRLREAILKGTALGGYLWRFASKNEKNDNDEDNNNNNNNNNKKSNNNTTTKVQKEESATTATAKDTRQEIDCDDDFEIKDGDTVFKVKANKVLQGFTSTKEAAKDAGVAQSSIRLCLDSSTLVGGYHWIRKESLKLKSHSTNTETKLTKKSKVEKKKSKENKSGVDTLKTSVDKGTENQSKTSLDKNNYSNKVTGQKIKTTACKSGNTNEPNMITEKETTAERNDLIKNTNSANDVKDVQQSTNKGISRKDVDSRSNVDDSVQKSSQNKANLCRENHQDSFSQKEGTVITSLGRWENYKVYKVTVHRKGRLGFTLLKTREEGASESQTRCQVGNVHADGINGVEFADVFVERHGDGQYSFQSHDSVLGIARSDERPIFLYVARAMKGQDTESVADERVRSPMAVRADSDKSHGSKHSELGSFRSNHDDTVTSQDEKAEVRQMNEKVSRGDSFTNIADFAKENGSNCNFKDEFTGIHNERQFKKSNAKSLETHESNLEDSELVQRSENNRKSALSYIAKYQNGNSSVDETTNSDDCAEKVNKQLLSSRPFCGKCNDRGNLVHHAWCKEHEVFKKDGAPEVFKRICKGVAVQCSTCLKEFEQGKKLKDLSHSTACQKLQHSNTSTLQSRRKPDHPKILTSAKMEAKVTSSLKHQVHKRLSDYKHTSAAQATFVIKKGDRQNSLTTRLEHTDVTSSSDMDCGISNTSSQSPYNASSIRKPVRALVVAKRTNINKKGKTEREKGVGLTATLNTNTLKRRRSISAVESNSITPKRVTNPFRNKLVVDNPSLNDETMKEASVDEDTIDVKWCKSIDPWGPGGMLLDDVIIMTDTSGIGNFDSLAVSPRFAMYPFSETVAYSRTHNSPHEGFIALSLERDLYGKLPWGFTFTRHEHGGACLVKLITPYSPAENARYIGTNDENGRVGLKPYDMLITVNGKPVGNMTEWALIIELETSGARLDLTVSRYKKQQLLQDRLQQMERHRLQIVDASLSLSDNISWVDICDKNQIKAVDCDAKTRLNTVTPMSNLRGQDCEVSSQNGKKISLNKGDTESVESGPILKACVNNTLCSVAPKTPNNQKHIQSEETAIQASEVFVLQLDKDRSSDVSIMSEVTTDSFKEYAEVTKKLALETGSIKHVENDNNSRVSSRSHTDNILDCSIEGNATKGTTMGDVSVQPSKDAALAYSTEGKGCKSSSQSYSSKKSPEDVAPERPMEEIVPEQSNNDDDSKQSIDENASICSDDNSQETWESDENAWLYCVCGQEHRYEKVFWIQCDGCDTWYNVSNRCVGFSEEKASDLPSWMCWACDPQEKDYTEPNLSQANKQLFTFANGDLIYIKEHAWPGVNNPAGIAKVVKSYVDDDGDLLYDVKYIVPSIKRFGVLAEYIERHSFD